MTTTARRLSYYNTAPQTKKGLEMRTKTRFGAVLMMVSYLLFTLSEMLEKAGERYEEVAPPYIAKAKAYSQKAGKWLAIHATAMLVLLACCLAAIVRGIRLLWNAIKRKAPAAKRAVARILRKASRTGQKTARTIHIVFTRIIPIVFGNIALVARKAWAFRAELNAEERGTATC